MDLCLTLPNRAGGMISPRDTHQQSGKACIISYNYKSRLLMLEILIATKVAALFK